MSGVRVAAREKRREELGIAIDDGERPQKKREPGPEEAFPIFLLNLNLWYDVEPMRPSEWMDVEIAPFREAQGYQRAWRDGWMDAEDQFKAGKH